MKLKEPVPPFIDKSILPLLPPKQLTLVVVKLIFGAIGSSSKTDIIELHPLKSVTVTE